MAAAGEHAGLLKAPPCKVRGRISAFVFAGVPCFIAFANIWLTICTNVRY
jgi:hypothetical protein